jgi:acyl-CoA thioester hydrolase
MSESAEPQLLARVPVSVRWRDLDAFNHVNNSTFLTYLEEARLVWLSRLDGGWISESLKPVLAATQVNFRQQIQWPGEIVVELYCERLGTSSLTISHRIVSPNGEHLHSDGNVVMVWIDTASGRSVPLPDVIRAVCAAR